MTQFIHFTMEFSCLEKLDIKYFTFTYQPQDAEVRSMPPVKDTLGFFIFKRTEP